MRLYALKGGLCHICASGNTPLWKKYLAPYYFEGEGNHENHIDADAEDNGSGNDNGPGDGNDNSKRSRMFKNENWEICIQQQPEDAAGQDSPIVGRADLGIEKFQENMNDQDRIEHGNKLYQDAVQLLNASPIKVDQRVFVKQQSTLARSFLSDELQKQKGILPTALRLVTQGFMSFFKSAPATTSTSTSSSAKESDDSQEPAKVAVKRHRDPMIAKAMDLLHAAGYEYSNDDALYTLASILFHGQYKVKRDLGQAFDMFVTLADRSGNATAQQIVGFMYSTGLGNVVERDEAKAVLYTTFAARGHNTAAELTLGYKYMLGIGTKKSCQDSVDYYKRAADKAHEMYLSGPPLGRTMPPIKIRLTDGEGGTYGAGASGPGTPSTNALASDIRDFIEFRRYIAEKDSPQAKEARFQLGILFYTGNAGSTTTIPRDYQKAGKYLKLVADAFFNSKTSTTEAILEAKEQRPKEAEEAGVTAALLGKMYWRGEGYEVDEEQALKWFQRGALLDNQVALNALGTMYMKGAAGLPVDNARAMEYFKKAAELKYPDAQVNMGLIYLNDPKLYTFAFKYFKEAFQMQNFQAVYHLGQMYYYGFGVPKKCDEAARYFKYVAERGDWDDTLFSDAHDAYEAGDIEYAAIGYLQAAERGYEVGQSNFAWILDRELPTSHYLTTLTSPSRTALAAISESALVSLGTPSRLLEMALVYWTRSANQGDVDARVKMGDYYFTGIGTEVDYKKATACYQVAAEAESSAMAMWNLGWMHENGVGVTKLNARYIWSYLTGGETGSEAGSFWSIGGKSTGTESSTKDSSGKADQGVEGRASDASGKDGSTGTRIGSGSRKSWDLDEISESVIEKWKSQKQAGPGEDSEVDDNDPFQHPNQHPRQGGEEDEEFLLEEEDLVEGLVIVGLCMVVGYLMYVRQFRFANQGQQQQQQNQNDNSNQQRQNNNNNNNNNNDDNNNNNNNNNNQNQPPPVVEGLPGDPHAPGRFVYYAAGG
ncbi:ERAD-associated protein [Modicella reniformis]|uniref:ERAD-associated protein n=1 Tax=Modicella reniformis TaxID=1440133 RepID=A0A9P6SV11_9FUNG|nr:ERAD-associated protein [Modicella reniformis]